MKKKRYLIKIILISIILMIITGLLNFSFAGIGDTIKDVVGDILKGLAGVLATGFQMLIIMLFAAIDALINGITGLTADKSAKTIGEILFNRVDITTANFFPNANLGVSTRASSFSEGIAQYYVIMRNLSIAMLLGILLYVGIRMAISTVASEEAKYKKMLYDWDNKFGSCLCFALHIMSYLC